MKLLALIDQVFHILMEFVLKVVGAFGAIWAVFAAVDIAYKHFFAHETNEHLMANPIYAKTALISSGVVAAISIYLFVKGKQKNRTLNLHKPDFSHKHLSNKNSTV